MLSCEKSKRLSLELLGLANLGLYYTNMLHLMGQTNSISVFVWSRRENLSAKK